MKSTHKALLTGLILNAALLFTSPASMAAGKEVTVDVAPPAERHELAPKARDGYVWAPGYWAWRGRFYTWTSGTWIVTHGGQHWVADRWEPQGSQWHYSPGHWESAHQAASTLQAKDQQ